MKNKETICVHPLSSQETIGNGVTAPIFPSTAYNYSAGEELTYPGFFSTYNQKRLGEIMAQLEGGEFGLAFNTGMSAIATTILSLVKSHDHIIFFNELYGGTWRFAKEELPQRGVSCSFAGSTLESLESCRQENTKVVYLETPSNPLMSILDLESIAKWAKSNNIITIVDNTFATPINQKPLELGIDISIHSGTKYLGGHNDLAFGAIVTSHQEVKKSLISIAKLYGGSLSPFSCYLAERSIKTLALRVERQNENAMKIAQHLKGHQKVKRVFYPGIDDHSGYSIAQKQMSGFGGMLSFELKASSNEMANFLSELNIVKPALSLGGVESLICLPAATSHVGLSKEEREKMGISETLLRLSVGIESAENLIEDLERAFEKVSA